MILANPIYWASALLRWDCLEWAPIKIEVIDYHLLHYYLSLPQPEVRYVLGKMFQGAMPRDETVKSIFREIYSLPPSGPCPRTSICTTVSLSGGLCFVLLFDPAHKDAWVIGRHKAGKTEYHSKASMVLFHGDKVWDYILWLHDWESPPWSSMRVTWQPWQTDKDGASGPVAIKAQERLMRIGIWMVPGSFYVQDIQSEKCIHEIRLEVVSTLETSILKAHEEWKKRDGHRPAHWPETQMHEVSHIAYNFDRFDWRPKWRLALEANANGCRACNRTAVEAQQRKPQGRLYWHTPEPTPLPVLLPEVRRENVMTKGRLALVKLLDSKDELRGARLKGSRPQTSAEQANALSEIAGASDRAGGALDGPATERTDLDNLTLNFAEDADSADEAPRRAGRAFLRPKARLGRPPPDWAARRNPRHPDAREPPRLPQYSGLRYRPHQLMYDDYELGPTIEELPTYPEYRTLATFEHFVKWSSATTFIDYGFRLLSNFHMQFYLTPPAHQTVMDHFLVVGLENYDPATQMSVEDINGQRTLAPRVQRDLEGTVSSSDVRIVGIDEMCAMAQNTDQPLDLSTVFIAGREPESMVRPNEEAKVLAVDAELDAVTVDPSTLQITQDADSLAWVGPDLQIKGMANIFTGPRVGKPPMTVHNGLYVDILTPQSDDDRHGSGRHEWYEKKTAVVHLPHTHFAQFSACVTGAVLNAHLIFPRMHHRDIYSNLWVSTIPVEVQEQLWNDIILPSLADVQSTEVEGSYSGETVDYNKHKSRTDSHPRGDMTKLKMRAVSANSFSLLQQHMRRRIAEGGDKHSRFKAFFIVLEARGIKHLTRKINQLDPWDALSQVYPSVDFDFLRDRVHGELIVDLGITISPPQKDKLVGLWRTEPLVAAFEAAGFKAGKSHMACHLARYGGMQAEMTAERMRQTQFIKFICYNLEYEAARPSNNQPTKVSDADAYHLSPHYLAYIRLRCLQYEMACRKSFGVRAEYRVGGEALHLLCSDPSAMMAQVKFHSTSGDQIGDRSITQIMALIGSNAIIWLHSKSWFDFQSLELKAVLLTQQYMRDRIAPSNYGTTTGVLASLLRGVGNTPRFEPVYVRQAMRDLNIAAVRDRFGMSFLPSLNLKTVGKIMLGTAKILSAASRKIRYPT